MTRIEETKAGETAASGMATEAVTVSEAKAAKAKARIHRERKADLDTGKTATKGTTQRGRKPKQGAAKPASTSATPSGAPPRPTKLDRLAALLARPEGASIAEMSAATGWQAHSVRGALAGALRKKGFAIGSAKAGDGVRRYRIEAGA